MTHHTEAERADFELMREAYEKAFGPPPVGAAWASVGYAIKTHEASEARAYAERFKGFVGGWVWRSAQAAPVPQGLREAAQRAHDWMERQQRQQSKGGHATFDMMMLREERDALADALAAQQPPEKDNE